MRISPVVPIAVVAVLVGVYVHDRQRTASDLEALRARSRTLQSKLDESIATANGRAPVVQILRVPVEPPAMPVGSALPEMPAAPNAVSPAAETGSVDPNEQRNKQFVLTSFEKDEYDASWATDAKHDIAERLGPISGSGSTVRGIECRSTMCKVDLLHRDQASASAFQRAVLMQSTPWPGGFSIEPEPASADGSIVSAMFVMRKGMNLPSASEQAL